MPAIGVIHPSHDERKANRAGRLPKWVTFEELREEALHADNPRWSPWNFELVNACLAEQQERGDNISTTALTGPCPRSTVLERKEDYVLELDAMWRAFRGTLVHRTLEFAARPGSIAEARFYAPLGDDVISCSPDLVTADGTIWDYKNTVEVPRYDYPYAGHAEQLQFNRYIVANSNKWEKDDKPYELPFDVRHMDFQHLVIMYMDMDGPRPLETMTSVQVATAPGAKNPTKSVRIPDVWDDEKVMWGWKTYNGDEIPGLVQRFKNLRLALDSYPKFPEELLDFWGGDPTWRCPGFPHCPLRGKCMASRYPDGLVW